jgi:uncharacterized protein YecE (DUF72 family)
MTVWIGTSGWSYPHWDNVLYAPGTPPIRRLAVYAEHFDTVELNASFYRWPRSDTFTGWHRRLPTGFQLSVKAPRGLTHGRRLYRPEQWSERIAQCWHALGDRRGILLVQLPPDQPRDDARLAYFLASLPRWIRVAVEFRHPSWHCEATLKMLEDHQAAYTVMSGAHLPCVLRMTAGFGYVRLHGPDPYHLYGGCYSEADLRWWAQRIAEWRAQGAEVYAYFNNDGFGHAVRNAQRLRELLRL